MIEPISNKNIEEFLPLIRQYQSFYEVANICDERNRKFFGQFNLESELGCLFGFRAEDRLVAFATVYFSFASSIPAKVGIMNDLFTLKSYRRQGIAKKLIQYCHCYALDKGAARLQWLTAKSNIAAQVVYEGIGAKGTSWQVYTLTE